jgi:hypothetical protein
MDREHARAIALEIPVIERILSSVFVGAGFRDCDRRDDGGLVSGVYAGKGMVWAVEILKTFDEFLRLWTLPSDNELKVVNVLMKVASAEEKWNLTLLIVVAEAVTEEMIAPLSRFQEEPSSFARFVISLEPDRPEAMLQRKLSALLMEWLDDSGSPARELNTVEDDIDQIVKETAAQHGHVSLDTVRDSLRRRLPGEDNVLSSLLVDVKRQKNDENK